MYVSSFRSEHNAVSGALVKLLHECIGSSVLTGKYCMLVMKCIWKVIRGLPSWLEAGMDVSLLLADLHSFLVSYPGSYWKQQADDTPMRTVKTVIHTLVKQQQRFSQQRSGFSREEKDAQVHQIRP